MPDATPGPPSDGEPVETWLDIQREARELAIRLEDEQREAAIIDEDRRAREEWLEDFAQSEAFWGDEAHGTEHGRDAA